MPALREDQTLSFKSSAGEKRISRGIPYHVLRTSAGLTVSRVSANGVVGLLYAFLPEEYNPCKQRLVFKAFGCGRTMPYLPAYPSMSCDDKPARRKASPVLVSETYFDLRQRIVLHNKNNLADTLDFVVLENNNFLRRKTDTPDSCQSFWH